jgi:hypothetical protein
MVRRPGVSTCVLVTVISSAYMGWNLAETTINGWPIFELPYHIGSLMSPSSYTPVDEFAVLALPHLRAWVGPSVATAWLMLFASGNWRPSADWGDRSGQLLGLAWIVVYLASPLTEYPFP